MQTIPTHSNSTALALTIGPHDMLAEWHAYLMAAIASGDVTDDTATTYRNSVRKFTAWLESTGAPSVTPKTVAEFKQAMLAKAKPASVNVWLSGVRAFYTWAVEAGHMPANPARDVKGAKRRGANKTHKRDRLTDAEAARLLTLPLPAREHAILALKLYTGVRDVEVRRAMLADLSTRNGHKVLMIRGKGHSDADEFVIVNAKCDDALAAWLAVRGSRPGPLFTSMSDKNKGGTISASALRDTMRAAFKQAGITEASKTSHSTRHTVITKVGRLAGPQAAQDVARHADPRTTLIYMHTDSRLENAAEELVDYNVR